MPTGRSTKDSDREKKSDFKSGMSHDNIISKVRNIAGNVLDRVIIHSRYDNFEPGLFCSTFESGISCIG